MVQKKRAVVSYRIDPKSEELAPICDRLMQLAEDYELDGILILVAELENNK